MQRCPIHNGTLKNMPESELEFNVCLFEHGFNCGKK